MIWDGIRLIARRLTYTAREISISDSTIEVIVDADKRKLAQVGAQLAWLGAALQESPSQDHLAHVFPEIATVVSDSATLRPTANRRNTTFIIRYRTTVLSDLDSQLPGHCWHSLFQNPVLIQDFPIPSRPDGEEGLEVSLDVMSVLGNARYLTLYDDIPVLKGFSTMFLLSGVSKNARIWHFVSKLSGDRISYAKASELGPASKINPSEFDRIFESVPEGEDLWPSTERRNFVGWVTSAISLAGRSFRYSPRHNLSLCWPLCKPEACPLPSQV